MNERALKITHLSDDIAILEMHKTKRFGLD